MAALISFTRPSVGTAAAVVGGKLLYDKSRRGGIQILGIDVAKLTPEQKKELDFVSKNLRNIKALDRLYRNNPNDFKLTDEMYADIYTTSQNKVHNIPMSSQYMIAAIISKLSDNQPTADKYYESAANQYKKEQGK